MKGACLCAFVAAATAHAALPPLADVQKKLRAIEVDVMKGQADTTRIALQDQARDRPSDVMLRVYIAWCAIPSDDAWNALKGIATVNPDNPWAQLGMARVYARWKMRDQSELAYRAALKIDRRFFPATTGLGDLARGGGKLPEAEQLYREALGVQDDAEARAGLGLALLAEGHGDDARKELERALELWPEQPEVLGALGRMSREAHDPKTAEKYAVRLADLAPKDGAARRLLADLRYELEEKAEAAKEYERVLRLGGADGEVLRRLAGLYKDTANAEGEEHALQQLAALDKQSPDAPLRLAELARARGALDEAEGQLLDAKQRRADRPDILVQLARVQLEREELKDARESYLLAAAAPGDKPAELERELAAVTAQLAVPKKPAKGSVDQIYGTVSSSLNALYVERLRAKPSLGGTLSVRAKVDDQGRATDVEFAQDSVGDPVIAGHVYFALKEAQYPKHKREPLFEFELKPPKKK